MTIYEVIANIRSLADNLVICGRRPWSEDTQFELFKMTEDFKVPDEAHANGLDYFIEVPIAREVLEALPMQNTSESDRAKLLLYYAENDAYPEQMFEEKKL